MKTISLYIITYNQEDVIARTLDSVLRQKDWGLFRIVVSDDCSKDRTWEILQDYKARYPELVYPYRNEHNLGIYANVQKAESYLPESDLYTFLAGDDEFCDGYFEAVQTLIETQKIDTKEAVGIYSDWVTVFPSGKESVFRQAGVLSGHDLWSLKARGIITSRSLIVTRAVKDCYEPVLEGRGLNLTESHYDAQAPLHIQKVYYIPQVTSKYYAGIGFSTRLDINRSDYLTTQSIEKWEYGLAHYVKNDCDRAYANYEIRKAKYYLHPSVGTFFKMIRCYRKGQLRGCETPVKEAVLNFMRLAKYGLCYRKGKT